LETDTLLLPRANAKERASQIPRDNEKCRLLPDPQWGALLFGATPEQLRYFDRRAGGRRRIGRGLEVAGLVILLFSIRWWLLSPQDPMFALTALIPFVIGLCAVVSGDAIFRLWSDDTRLWGIYENGIVCPGQGNSRHARFQPWESIKMLELLGLEPVTFGPHKGSNWMILVPGVPYQVGTIRKGMMMDLFGLKDAECATLREGILAGARAFLPPEKVSIQLQPADWQ